MNNLLTDNNRLKITALLITSGIQDFTSIRDHLDMTDGNLNFHLKKLEKEHIINVTKTFEDSKPKTYISISEQGRTIFLKHIDYLEQLIMSVK